MSDQEYEILKSISQEQYLSMDAFMKKLVLQGIDTYRMDKAVNMYKNNEVDLNTAAHISGVSIRKFMTELEKRGVKLNISTGMLKQSLKDLSEMFRDTKLQKAIQFMDQDSA